MSVWEYAKALMCEYGREILKEFGADAAVDGYVAMVVKFADHYLENSGTNPAILGRYRTRFYQVLKVTIIVLDEIDSYLTGNVISRWRRVHKIMSEHLRELPDNRRGMIEVKVKRGNQHEVC